MLKINLQHLRYIIKYYMIQFSFINVGQILLNTTNDEAVVINVAVNICEILTVQLM